MGCPPSAAGADAVEVGPALRRAEDVLDSELLKALELRSEVQVMLLGSAALGISDAVPWKATMIGGEGCLGARGARGWSQGAFMSIIRYPSLGILVPSSAILGKGGRFGTTTGARATWSHYRLVGNIHVC